MEVLVVGLGISAGGSVLAATPISGVTTFNGPEYALVSGVANGEGLLAEDVFGYDFRLVMNSAVPVGLYVGDLVWETGNGVQYYPDGGSAVSMNRLVVTSNGGEDFSLQGFGLSLTGMTLADTELTVVVTGYKDGSEVGTFSRTLALENSSVTSLEPFDVSGVAGFASVDEFRITSGVGAQIGYLGIDNLHVVNVVPEPSVAGLVGSLALLGAWRRRR